MNSCVLWEGNVSASGYGRVSCGTFTGNFTWLKGNHDVRFGPEFRLYRVFSDRHSTDDSPALSFNSLWGRGPNDNSTAPPVGGELTALLLGIPGGNATRSGSFAQQDKYVAFYVQDDWKLTRKLTLNLGMRIEHESPVTDNLSGILQM